MLDKSSIIGLVLGIVLVLGAILPKANIMIFIDIPSFIIVAGGLFASTMVSFDFNKIKGAFALMMRLMRNTNIDLRTDMEVITLFARRVRTGGLLILDEDIKHLDDVFLKNGLQLAVDGFKTESLNSILSDEITSEEEISFTAINVLNAMSNFAPAFGMIGTVIGMVLMLQNLTNPEALGAGIAVALLTTLYGSMLSNMLFAPLAGKVSYLAEKDINRKKMFRVAILSIVEGENPRIMEKKMLIYIEPAERAEYVKHHEELKIMKTRDEKLYKLWKEQQGKEWENLKRILEPG
jgi:chemotaxis protein MotA